MKSIYRNSSKTSAKLFNEERIFFKKTSANRKDKNIIVLQFPKPKLVNKGKKR